jgi:hypothetical protein
LFWSYGAVIKAFLLGGLETFALRLKLIFNATQSQNSPVGSAVVILFINVYNIMKISSALPKKEVKIKRGG